MQLSKTQLALGAVILIVIAFFIGSRTSKTPESTALTSTTTETGAPVSTTENTDTTASPSASPAEKAKTVSTASPAAKAPVPLTGRTAPDFVRPTGFMNSDTLGLVNTNQFTLAQFIGKKVILVNFWTSSSLNSLRMFPYLNQWNLKYAGEGLMIVSIHAPRFAFERTQNVIEEMAHAHNIIHPIVLDNNFETWNAYKNSVWPHQYLIDLNGRIVYDNAGEGAYETTEVKIQSLLAARAAKLGTKFVYEKFETPKDAYSVDLAKVGSPETYIGAGRNQTLANGTPLKLGPQSLARPTDLTRNTLFMSGAWNFMNDNAESMTEGGGIIYRYSAKSVYALLGASTNNIRMKVLLDGKPLDATTAGSDVRFEKGESIVYVNDERIYNIVNNQAGYGEHTVELVSTGGGLDVYTLTFG